MENLFWIGFVGAAGGRPLRLGMQAKKVMTYSEGTERMQKIAASIRAGANAYLKQQYTTVVKVFVVVFIILLIIAFASGGKMLSQFTPFAFLTGGIWSMLAGFIGMKIATNSNARTAQAASESLNKGLRVAFSSGSVMGFTVVGLGMLDITLWFFILRYVLRHQRSRPAGQHHGHERHGRLLHGPVRPCGRRHLHQGRRRGRRPGGQGGGRHPRG